MVRAVYVGEHASLEQVRAAVKAWQKQTGDATRLDVEAAGDGYPGMGYVIDVFIRDEDAQLAFRDRLAEGLKPLLPGIPVATDTEMNDRQIAAAAKRHR